MGIHETNGYQNCYTGNQWDTGRCSDPAQCAQNCALEGVSKQKYENTYGIKQVKDGVRLNFVTDHQYGSNVGSRLYVMEDDENYAMFYLKNREFSFEVDVSELYCGMNGAMYFTEMQADGGKGIGNNNAGAKYGTGYCDAQCPHDMKFIDGEANVIDWTPNSNDKSNNMGAGKYGACCAEMDIWEANSMASAFTPHTCSTEKLYRCSDPVECGDNASGNRYDGVCDKDGCDINPYRMGVEDFYGRGDQYAVNTLKPMTVVTQFLTHDGTDTGDFSEMRRLYIQDGKIVHSPPSTILGPGKESDSITDQFCDDKKELFGDVKDYQEHGGMKGMGESLDRGHAMIFSLWDDVEVNMLWLDSAYPLDRPITDPGIKRGDCPGGETSTPTYLRQKYPNGGVIFKNAAVGEIGSTFVPPPPTQPPVPTQPPAPSNKPTPSPAGQQCDTSGCCSHDFASCITWCGSTKNECLSCGQEVGWICGEQTGCKPRWGDCSDDQNGCCDGLSCVTVNPGYSQCRIVDITEKPSPAPSPNPTAKPTSIPTEIRLPTTSSPTFSLSPTSEGCFSNNYKDCLPKSQLNGPASCNTVWLPNGPQQGCVALWEDCTDDSNSCCGDAVCFGDADDAVCKPPNDSTDLPTPKPTIPEPSPKPTTLKPTNAPSKITPEPTNQPSGKPTNNPTTEQPTYMPTYSPTSDSPEEATSLRTLVCGVPNKCSAGNEATVEKNTVQAVRCCRDLDTNSSGSGNWPFKCRSDSQATYNSSSGPWGQSFMDVIPDNLAGTLNGKCIETDFDGAVKTCAANNARLCTPQESQTAVLVAQAVTSIMYCSGRASQEEMNAVMMQNAAAGLVALMELVILRCRLHPTHLRPTQPLPLKALQACLLLRLIGMSTVAS